MFDMGAIQAGGFVARLPAFGTYSSMRKLADTITTAGLPDNTTVNNSHWLTGELVTSSRSRTYAVGYTYDYAGRMKTLTTWTGFAGGAGSAVTTWKYSATRGLLGA